MTVRVALIGAGVMGADHARIFAEDVPNAQLRVVCDASPERAERIAQACGVRDVSTDPLSVIARSDIDAVVIASPDQTHAPLSIAAIRAGKPVLCEKPLSRGLDECLRVIEEEVKLGRRMGRFDPSYTEMKALLDTNEIGRGTMFHCQHRNVAAPANFTGQMAITNSAPHEFDIARFVLDSEVVGSTEGGDLSPAPRRLFPASRGCARWASRGRHDPRRLRFAPPIPLSNPHTKESS